jgi:RNA-directed DNA polymerase
VSSLNSNNNGRLNVNGNNWNDSNNGYAFGMALKLRQFLMKTYKNIYYKIYELNNLVLAYKKARKGKTKKDYVIKFEEHLNKNLKNLQFELMSLTYKPPSLKKFILRDPKTRTISRSDFRDRVVHHAICNIIEPLFNKSFIYGSCANQKGKGNLFAIKRFNIFKRKISKNNTKNCYILKADIKHYFREVNHNILINLITRKISDKKVLILIRKILDNNQNSRERERETRQSDSNKGMPLGNLTSQLFANIYLNELDYFVKHNLKLKYYLRYVDDFVILHKDEKQLIIWKNKIKRFLKQELKIELHPDKTRIISLKKGIDFVGFRNFYYFRLLRKRNIKKMKWKKSMFNQGLIKKEKFLESLQGWNAYAKWADTYKLRKNLFNDKPSN